MTHRPSPRKPPVPITQRVAATFRWPLLLLSAGAKLPLLRMQLNHPTSPCGTAIPVYRELRRGCALFCPLTRASPSTTNPSHFFTSQIFPRPSPVSPAQTTRSNHATRSGHLQWPRLLLSAGAKRPLLRIQPIHPTFKCGTAIPGCAPFSSVTRASPSTTNPLISQISPRSSPALPAKTPQPKSPSALPV